ncbi:GSCOCG00006397001-RA-CDS [Cotesia congregata]|nr:GSCOCG00006397001-RA-CDS [Cotesia congregata]
MVDTLRYLSLSIVFRKLLLSVIRLQRVIKSITRSYNQQRLEKKTKEVEADAETETETETDEARGLDVKLKKKLKRMTTIEEKKRVAGSKVSAIANIFQSKPQHEGLAHHHRPTTIHPEGGFKEPPAPLSDSPTQVTVVRTESHVARFNNARALFEKLGEENKTNRP